MARPMAIKSAMAASVLRSGRAMAGYRSPRRSAVPTTLPKHHSSTGHGATRGYIHHADSVLFAAADKVADAIAERMGEPCRTGSVVPLRGVS